MPCEPIYNNAGVPYLLPDANASSITAQGFNNVFLINCGGTTQAKTEANFMVKTLGAKAVAVVDNQSAFATNLAQLTDQDVVADGGTVADKESVPATQVNLSSLISKLKSMNVGAIYFTGYYSPGRASDQTGAAGGTEEPDRGWRRFLGPKADRRRRGAERRRRVCDLHAYCRPPARCQGLDRAVAESLYIEQRPVSRPMPTMPSCCFTT